MGLAKSIRPKETKLMTHFRMLVASLLFAVALPLGAVAQEAAKSDQVVVLVNDNDPKTMNLVLNNIQNLIAYYKDKGEKVQIEVVAFGPGLHMLRQDTSPVKERVTSMSAANPELQFSACSNTLAGMTKQEGTKPELVSEAKLIPSGVARIVELQKTGYLYLRP
jgi:intracellular sulfur oxidation DsrE/DsrF family protein